MRYIPLFDSFVFNGKSSLDFKCKISGNETFRRPARDITSIEVPGRNGELTIDNGRYKNVTIPYNCFIAENIRENLSSLINWLSQSPGYSRLEDSYHPNEYRMARYTGPLDPEVFYAEDGRFDLEFDCQPQRWLTSGEQPVEVSAGSSVVLVNPTLKTALPKIVVTAGTGQIGIGSQTASKRTHCAPGRRAGARSARFIYWCPATGPFTAGTICWSASRPTSGSRFPASP